jgi:hypothetical protein
VRDRAVGVAGHLQQMRPHRVEPVVAGQPGVEAGQGGQTMAAWSWYSPTALLGSTALSNATPSLISVWSQRVRSCSASGMSWPCGPVRAGRRASVSSMSASRPATSGSSGSNARSARTSRIASRDRPVRASGTVPVRSGCAAWRG